MCVTRLSVGAALSRQMSIGHFRRRISPSGRPSQEHSNRSSDDQLDRLTARRGMILTSVFRFAGSSELPDAISSKNVRPMTPQLRGGDEEPPC